MSDTDSCFHATLSDLGETFTFARGSKYEKVREDGTPVQRVASGNFMGFGISDTPELVASKSPEAATFAVLKNYINETGDSRPETDISVSIYEISREPDVDLGSAIVGDFAALEEVRYRHPSDDPISTKRAYHTSIPGRAAADVDLAYLPPSQVGVIDKWAAAVQQALKSALETGTYPEDVANEMDIPRPDPEPYRRLPGVPPEHA